MSLAFTGADEDGVAQPVDWYGAAVELDRSNRVKTTPKISSAPDPPDSPHSGHDMSRH